MQIRQINTPDGGLADRSFSSLRTLYVMIGGSGMRIGLRLRRRIFERHGRAELPFQRFLWLDTDRRDMDEQDLGSAQAIRDRLAFSGSDFLDISMELESTRNFLARPNQYEWVWKHISPRDLRDMGTNAAAVEGAAQMRALGRLAFANKFPEFRQLVQRQIDALNDPSVDRESRELGYELEPGSTEIVLLCSIAGGTGAGAFLDAARALKALGGDRGWKVSAYLLLPSVFQFHFQDRPAPWLDVQANAYAALQELSATHNTHFKAGGAPPLGLRGPELATPDGFPFHEVFLVDSDNEDKKHLAGGESKDAFEMVAEALFYDLEKSAFGTKKRSHRCNTRPHLASVTQYLMLVEDDRFGTDPAAYPRYVFQLPNSFGSFGIARVPFERKRLQRAAGAWLVREMLELMVRERSKMPPETIRSVLSEKYGKVDNLTATGVIDQLLRDSSGGSYIDTVLGPVRKALQTVRQNALQEVSTEGEGPKEALDRVARGPRVFQQVADKVADLIREVTKDVDARLRDGEPVDRQGEHFKSILAARTPIRERYQKSLDELAYDLLSQPVDYGYSVLGDVLELLEADHRKEMGRSEKTPERPECTAPTYSLPPDIRGAIGRLEEAVALRVLPPYGQIAVSTIRNQVERRLSIESDSQRKTLNAFIDDVDTALSNWVERRYQQVARESASQLFADLARHIGSITVRVKEDGTREAVPTGLRLQFQRFRDRFNEAATFFRALEKMFRSVEETARNGADASKQLSLEALAQKTLDPNRDDYDVEDTRFLMIAWEKCILGTGIISTEGRDNPIEAGLRRVVEVALEGSATSNQWRGMLDDIESWGASYFSEQNFLSGISAQSEISKYRDGELRRELQHICENAAPFLPLATNDALTQSAQAAALLGTSHPDADDVKSWRRESRVQVDGFQNDTGPIVLYREKMAFPLPAVTVLPQFKAAYDQLAKDRPQDLIRRHTVREPSALPIILPPHGNAEAKEWFEIEVLALEATLFGLFQACSHGADPEQRLLEFEYLDKQHSFKVARIPRSFRAITSELRTDDRLRQVVAAKVESLTNELLRPANDGQDLWALRTLTLASRTQNVVFPAAATERAVDADASRYLEHEVARAVFMKWATTWRRLNQAMGMMLSQQQEEEYLVRIVNAARFTEAQGYHLEAPVRSEVAKADILSLNPQHLHADGIGRG